MASACCTSAAACAYSFFSIPSHPRNKKKSTRSGNVSHSLGALHASPQVLAGLPIPSNSIGNLNSELDGLPPRRPPLGDGFAQAFPTDVLHGHEGATARLIDIVDGSNVGGARWPRPPSLPGRISVCAPRHALNAREGISAPLGGGASRPAPKRPPPSRPPRFSRGFRNERPSSTNSSPTS